jgi:hypothetical protein
MKKKIKDLISEEELRQYFYEWLDEYLTEKAEGEAQSNSQDEYIERPSPHYLSEYGKYLVKTPMTLSRIDTQQLKALHRLMVMAERGLLDKNLANLLIRSYLKLKVSVKGRGREDLKYIARFGSQRQETTILTRAKAKEDIL